jgi:hypothetical protein
LVRNLREKKRFGDIDINGRIILKWILEEWCEGIFWIQLAQDRVQWWTSLSTVTFKLHKMQRIYYVTISFLRRTCTMKLLAVNELGCLVVWHLGAKLLQVLPPAVTSCTFEVTDKLAPFSCILNVFIIDIC